MVLLGVVTGIIFGVLIGLLGAFCLRRVRVAKTVSFFIKFFNLMY